MPVTCYRVVIDELSEYRTLDADKAEEYARKGHRVYACTFAE